MWAERNVRIVGDDECRDLKGFELTRGVIRPFQGRILRSNKSWGVARQSSLYPTLLNLSLSETFYQTLIAVVSVLLSSASSADHLVREAERLSLYSAASAVAFHAGWGFPALVSHRA